MEALGRWIVQLGTSLMPHNLYVLQLAEGKYYVGQSDDLDRRIQEHFSGKGAEWTRKYPPVRTVETLYGDENSVTKQLMMKHGIANVRGGSYCEIILPKHVEDILLRELRGDADLCFVCGADDHWGAACPQKKCTRCGRNNHSVENCYAATYLNGTKI
jgi:predicted GIY-YIG superfamily endonuclease